MEFILINENKIKVMLSEEDLDEFEIDAEEMDYSNTETKRMFWDILSRAKHSTGFDTDGQRVLVQLYPSRKGGCEMFVTKIGLLSDSFGQNEADDTNNPHIADRMTVRSHGKRNLLSKKEVFAYSFDSIGDVLRVCRRLADIGYSEESSLYIDENEKIYLFLCGIEKNYYPTVDDHSFICEFGRRINRETTQLYLAEHGRRICNHNAVAYLSTL